MQDQRKLSSALSRAPSLKGVNSGFTRHIEDMPVRPARLGARAFVAGTGLRGSSLEEATGLAPDSGCLESFFFPAAVERVGGLSEQRRALRLMELQDLWKSSGWFEARLCPPSSWRLCRSCTNRLR